MPKKLLFILTLIVILLTAYATMVLNTKQPQEETWEKEVGTAINQAKYLYDQKKMRMEDFSNGPCLSDALMPGWVVDIVHQPRQAIDDLVENQCPAYIEGRAKHFVELDMDGNLVRAR